jgi:hypothetical protein
VFSWCVWQVFELAFATNLHQTQADFVVLVQFIFQNLLFATISTRMLLKQALFLMLNGFLVCDSKTHYLLHIQIIFDLIFLSVLASLNQAEKSSCHQLIFNISMKILVFGVFALHGALEGLLFLPKGDAVMAEGRLAGAAFFRIVKHLEANGALEVSIILLNNTY